MDTMAMVASMFGMADHQETMYKTRRAQTDGMDDSDPALSQVGPIEGNSEDQVGRFSLKFFGDLFFLTYLPPSFLKKSLLNFDLKLVSLTKCFQRYSIHHFLFRKAMAGFVSGRSAFPRRVWQMSTNISIRTRSLSTNSTRTSSSSAVCLMSGRSFRYIYYFALKFVDKY